MEKEISSITESMILSKNKTSEGKLIHSGDLLTHVNLHNKHFFEKLKSNKINMEPGNWFDPIEKLMLAEYFIIPEFHELFLGFHMYQEASFNFHFASCGNDYFFGTCEQSIHLENTFFENEKEITISWPLYGAFKEPLTSENIKRQMLQAYQGKIGEKIILTYFNLDLKNNYVILKFNLDLKKLISIKFLNKIKKGIECRKNWFKNTLDYPKLHVFLDGKNIFNLTNGITKNNFLKFFYSSLSERKDVEIFFTKDNNIDGHREYIYKTHKRKNK